MEYGIVGPGSEVPLLIRNGSDGGGLKRIQGWACSRYTPTVRFNWVNEDNFRFYFSFGINGRVKNDQAIIGIDITNFCVIPAGVTFGRKLFGYMEFGYSYLRGNVRFGIGYRF